MTLGIISPIQEKAMVSLMDRLKNAVATMGYSDVVGSITTAGQKKLTMKITVPSGETWLVYDVDAFGVPDTATEKGTNPTHAPGPSDNAVGDKITFYVGKFERECTDYTLTLDKGFVAYGGQEIQIVVEYQDAPTTTEKNLRVRLYYIRFTRVVRQITS